jgi:3-phosphoshikimate 1-carboxyvinyltransferase
MSKKFSVLIKNKINKFNKTIKIPTDKSLSLRSIILASQCIGISKIKNLLESEDVMNCVKALRQMGVKIVKNKNYYLVYGNGLNSFKIKKKITKIFVGNSGTTARLLSGLLATLPNKFYIYGDKSMNKRDMSRVINPLEKIGCFFYPPQKKTLPLILEGTSMPLAQKHIEKKGSAQIKSLILLSALSTNGNTTVVEEKISRNHTELFLKRIGANIKIKKLKKGNLITLSGQKNLYAFDYTISSDPSSMAFPIALTLLTPKSKLIVHNVLCNPTRIGFIKVLKEKMNANIKIKNLKKVSGELVGSIVVKSSKLKNINCPKELVPSLIDELPILFVIAGLTKGISKFTSINEATKKESNRIEEMRKILLKVGILCKSTNDKMTIFGKSIIKFKKETIVVNTDGDHRICMSAIILGLLTGMKMKIKNFETVNTSFPNFIPLIKSLGGKFEIKKS